MKDGKAAKEVGPGVSTAHDASSKSKPAANGDDSTYKSPSKPAAADGKTNNLNIGASGDARSDSEAETVVLPGKQDGPTSPRRAIKHEGNGDAKRTDSDSGDVIFTESWEKQRDKPPSDLSSSPKTKKPSKDNTATSSNLSSTNSSPAPAADAKKPASDQAGIESSEAKTKQPLDGDAHAKNSNSRKRKINGEDTDDKGNKRRQRRDGDLESPANLQANQASEGNRRDNRKTASTTRSESPQPRTRNRALSIKSASSQQQPAGVLKKRKPPPLQVHTKNRDEGGGSSDGSNSPAPVTGNLRRLVSVDSSAISPAKMPPHKKLKDKSGRTFLARACDSEQPDAVRIRLKERPEDLDVADYAGNTPLQIAALAGSAEIVKILLDAGCKTDCKNVDQDTPLIDAVENGHLDVIKLLLEAGLDPRQSNAKGEELLDLLSPDNENYHEIKEVLIKAKDQKRRPSDDMPPPKATERDKPMGQRDRGSNVTSPPAVTSAAAASRRRTARSEATRNDLLWVNATAENLREKAKIGDNAAVDHILNMRPIADIPAVLAAARGGHEISLQLLIAIGKPEEDPDPLPTSKPGQGTPMLAAIGRRSLRVIELLLEQPGFDPTRRLYRGMAYHEIARERKGPNWEQEYKILKKAYDKHTARSSKGSFPLSKRDSTSQKESKRPKESSNSSAARGVPNPSSPDRTRDGQPRKKPLTDTKGVPPRPNNKEQNSPEHSRDNSKKHLKVPSKPISREQSSALSDREGSPFGNAKDKKVKRSLSDEGRPGKDAPKPRKRLVSRRALRDDEEKSRRASIVSLESSTSSQEPAKFRDSITVSQPKVKREESRDDSKPSLDSIKKRRRASPSPSEGHDSNSRRSPESVKKAKRVRVDADGKVKNRADSDGATSKREPPGPQDASQGTASKSSSTTQSTVAAPVAFMAGSSAPQNKDSAKRATNKIEQGMSTAERRKPSSKISSPPHKTDEPSVDKSKDRKEDKENLETGNQLQRDLQKVLELEERQKKEQEQLEEQENLKEQERLAREEADRVARAATREAERAARAAEAARAEERKLQEEAERKAKADEEARLEKQRQEEDARKERIRQEEEARKEKIRQEEAQALEKKRQEERAREIAERERLRKEEQKLLLQRLKELEESERRSRIRRLEEEERRRREALPNALKIAAELSPEQARQQSEIKHWLPLFTTKGRQLDPNCEKQFQEELWVTNLQAAPILGLKDLDLSQYSAWTKRSATEKERFSLWRVLRRKLTRYDPPANAPVDHSKEFHMDTEAHNKYDALRSVFWIRLSDLQDVAPRYPHLAGIDLKCSAMALTEVPPAKSSPRMNGHAGPLTNGVSPSAPLPNGYH